MGNCHSNKRASNVYKDDDDSNLPSGTITPRFFHMSRSIQSINETSKSLDIDISEEKRLQSLHDYMLNLWQSKFFSPIHHKLVSGAVKVLDVGCGTGAWIIDMANKYPHTKFIGLDVSPIFSNSPLPYNVEFVQADLLKGLPFDDNTFDFVYMSNMVRYLSTKQWEDIVIKELVRVSKPYAFIEVMEGDLTLHNKGPVTTKLHEAFLASMHAKGISPLIETIITRIFQTNPNLTNFNVETKIGYLNMWGGLQNLENGLKIFKLSKKSNLEFMSSTPSEYDAMLETYVKEIDEYNTYCKFYRFYAQKIELPPSPVSFRSSSYINYSSSSTHKNLNHKNSQLLLRSNSTSSKVSSLNNLGHLKNNSLNDLGHFKNNSSNNLSSFKDNSLKKIPSRRNLT
ncbi:S-adenosyl-L-methionine-dependent methyltransferase [Gigaspora margarita]|uniref:S-adenosyl-L-methionine-dependent methyltransferase n=1 Tax=Gigaspora margarita TaxID=4874 RepID=A0A8H4AGT7_GIGMA|nr:S-adenosyl-L-methionine-dependent methyltransferase [Gigaspora margarita]